MYDKIDRLPMNKYAFGYFPEERNDNGLQPPRHKGS